MANVDLLEALSNLPDPRVLKKTLHRLDEMVFIAICAVISGADGWSGIVEFAETKEDWLRRFLRLENGIPVDDTFARVLSVLSPKAFADCLLNWTRELAAAAPAGVIAIDGKTARRSHDRRRRQNPLHLVRAWAIDQGLALGLVKTDVKSNEITAIPALLEMLELRGALVTIDAMGCQTAIAKQIIDQGGDYLLAVKDNQPTLHADLQDFFATARAKDFAGVAHDYAQTTDSDHGRIEVRRCWVSECLDTLADAPRWAGLKTLVLIERNRIIGDRMSREQAFYISSRPADARQLGQAARGHWAIENNCHWVIDVTFNEDQSRIRRGHGAQNFAILRQGALNLLKQEPSKASIPRKRQRAALADDYRLQVLGGAT